MFLSTKQNILPQEDDNDMKIHQENFNSFQFVFVPKKVLYERRQISKIELKNEMHFKFEE